MFSFGGKSRRSARRRYWRPSVAIVETLEQRVLMTASPIGGVGNNVANPTWGSAGVDLLRMAPAGYTDGSTPAGESRPSARVVSDTVSAQGDVDIINNRMMSAMVYAWGQFIDHDIDLTPTGSEPLSIPVPAADPYFDPNNTGTATIDTTRSIYDPSTGTSASNPRQQVNVITAFIDGSMIYGSDAATAASLRTFVGGKLKTSAGNLLPLDPSSTPGDPNALFLAGDVRANENVELTALQTLFVREHNFWADQIAKQNPKLNDQQVYDQARARVVAEIQNITYNQWLPALLGQNALPKYTGYDKTVNPGVANEFSTAAFRFGHSLLGNDVEFLNNAGLEVHDEVPLSGAFFNPALVKETGIDPILKYLASDPSSEVDTKVVDSVRNFLFGQPGQGGLDLASLNIERGRDNGLADYNTVRAAYGLPKVTSFSQITSDTALQAKLQSLYGDVNNIDLWVGALAEDHVPGASVGQTLKTIISDQFERLRDGDRFFYQTQFSGRTLSDINNTTLATIIARNTTTTNLQQNTFFFNSTISGNLFIDSNRNGRLDRGEPAAAGLTVSLIDKTSGEVVATGVTDPRGNYRFGVIDGLRTGQYTVRVTLRNGSAGPSSGTLAITRGDQFLTANFGVPPANTTPNPPPGQPGPRPRSVSTPFVLNQAATPTALSAATQESNASGSTMLASASDGASNTGGTSVADTSGAETTPAGSDGDNGQRTSTPATTGGLRGFFQRFSFRGMNGNRG